MGISKSVYIVYYGLHVFRLIYRRQVWASNHIISMLPRQPLMSPALTAWLLLLLLLPSAGEPTAAAAAAALMARLHTWTSKTRCDIAGAGLPLVFPSPLSNSQLVAPVSEQARRKSGGWNCSWIDNKCTCMCSRGCGTVWIVENQRNSLPHIWYVLSVQAAARPIELENTSKRGVLGTLRVHSATRILCYKNSIPA